VKRAALIQEELVQIGTIADLATVFEGIASMEIAKLRDQTLGSKRYFADLWHVYSQLRVDRGKSKRRHHKPEGDGGNSRTLFVAITSQGGLSGDIDSQVIDAMVKDYVPATTDVMVVGGHGAQLLAQVRVPIVKEFRMPESTAGFGINVVEPIIAEATRYAHTMTYYQTYASLSKQEVAKVELIATVKDLDEKRTPEQGEIISQREYDFEPSLIEIVEYLESMMLGVLLSQVVLESKLSQAASRFNAMARAKQKAKEMQVELRLAYNRSKRSASDERTREIIAVLNRT
jgi:F-type H+-transporting ATPase subunit gamma